MSSTTPVSPSPAMGGSGTGNTNVGQQKRKFIPQVAVVDFHHARGPEVEFWVTETGSDIASANDWSLLPFLALSDGAHASAEDFAYFTLLCREGSLPVELPAVVPASGWKRGSVASIPKSDTQSEKRNSGDVTAPLSKPRVEGETLFGIACTRQIRADKLKVKSKDVTRSTVQKAVVVILDWRSIGKLGSIRERVGAVAGAWFGQEDFTNIDILKEFQESLEIEAEGQHSYEDHHLGLSIREIVHEFRHHTLELIKAMLLQKKMLFFGSKCEKLCLLQFALISLLPNLMQNLVDCADPALDKYAKTITRAASLKSSERNSLLAYMGLPLQIFGDSSFFSPYTPLQQLDLLMDASTHSFVVGSTNNLLLAQKDRYCDILVNLDDESNKMQIINQALRPALALSAADRRWIDNIVQTVLNTWDPANPSRPNTHGYAGSEDAIRLQFEEYVLSLLSSDAYRTYLDNNVPSLDHAQHAAVNDYPDSIETSNDFNITFLTAWRETPNHKLFDRLTRDAAIYDIIAPKHPTAGGLNIEDVQRRLAQGMAELHLDARVKEGRETVGRVMNEGRERVGAGVARFWKEVEDFKQRREASRENMSAGGGRGSTDASAIRDNVNAPPGLSIPTLTTTNVNATPTTPYPGVNASSTGNTPVTATSSWSATLRDRANKVTLPETSQLSASAREGANKAGQYLSSWGSWARDRSRGWAAGRTNEGGADGGNNNNINNHANNKMYSAISPISPESDGKGASPVTPDSAVSVERSKSEDQPVGRNAAAAGGGGEVETKEEKQDIGMTTTTTTKILSPMKEKEEESKPDL